MFIRVIVAFLPAQTSLAILFDLPQQRGGSALSTAAHYMFMGVLTLGMGALYRARVQLPPCSLPY